MGLGSQSPNNREGLSAVSSITGNNEYVYSTDHALHVNATVTPPDLQDVNLTKVAGVAISLGQTTMSASLPITIASDQSALAVSQSGTWNIGTVATITNPVAATQSGTWSTRTQDGSGNAITSTASALDVNIKSGNITGYATSANQTNGTQLTQIVDAGGDAVTVTGGKLDVNATISGSGGGTSAIDDTAFVAAVDSGTPMMGFATSDAVDSGDVGVLAMDVNRNLKVIAQSNSGVDIGDVTVNNASGAAAVNIQDGGNVITVDGSGTAGSAAAGVQTIQGIASMTPVQVSQATASNLNAQVAGDVAAGAADSGNPVKVGGKYNSTLPTYTDGNRGDLQVGTRGALNVQIMDQNGTNAVTVATAADGGVLTRNLSVRSINMTYNGSGVDLGRSVINATNSTGTGIVAVGNLAQFDDVSPTSITENQFGNLRMSANRNLYGTIRDAAGNERGVNVNASNQLSVSVDAIVSNQSVNLAQVNGVTTLTGTGATGTGAQRVTVAVDSATVAGSASLPAGTNAIGKLAANSGVDIGDVDVTSAVSATLDHGSNRDIDTAAEQITSTSFAAKYGVTLKADVTNTGILYIGNSDVTAGTTAATDGIPLSAGESITLPVTNSNIPYAIASANNQIIYWIAV